MMLFVLNKVPNRSFQYLVDNSNKNFIFKSLLELAQLICSCGYSNIYKSVKQGKELQEWIKKNEEWTFRYYSCLWFWCASHIKMKNKTLYDTYMIKSNFYDKIKHRKRISYPKTAVFRFKKDYKCKYKTNTELPIQEAVEQYRKYLSWKFPKEVKNETD